MDDFLDTADKLEEIEITIHQDLLSVLMLCSLPPSFDAFRRAMTTRDDIPKLEVMKIKILEDYDSRKVVTTENTGQDVLFAKKGGNLKKKFNHSNSLGQRRPYNPQQSVYRP